MSHSASKPVEGMGYLPTFTRFIPELEELDLVQSFVPTEDEISGAPRLRIYGEKAALMTCDETEKDGVASQLNKALNISEFEGIHAYCGDNNFNCPASSSQSAIPTSVLVSKGATELVLDALRQAVILSMSVQLHLLRRGLPRERCVVPVIGATGIGLVFGVSIVLEPSFPTFIPLSKHLDLSDPHERKVASAYLTKCSQWSRKLSEEVASFSATKANINVDTNCICLDTSAYFVKTINEEVYQRGFGLFGDDLDIQPGLTHMVEALNKLYASESARHYVEFPLALHTPCSDYSGGNYYQVIYRNLCKLGYRTGCPHRIQQPELFESYVKVLRTAVSAIWNAGVIHTDLFISNIMYRVGENSDIQIKIVDWDVAHCVDEGDFVEKVKIRLSDFYENPKLVQFNEEHDKMFIDALTQDLSRIEDEDAWDDLASGDKKRIDSAFRYLLLRYNYERMRG